MSSVYSFPFKTIGEYQYWDEGPQDAPALLYLHGILGDVENWKSNITPLAAAGYRVIVPLLPCYKMPLRQTHVPGLAAWVHGFVEAIGMPETMIVVGNSLGGQVALYYIHDYAPSAFGLVLAGSSGIRELAMRGEFFRRKDVEFIRSRARLTFHDAEKHFTDHFLEEVSKIVNNTEYALKLIAMARSSATHIVGEMLPKLTMPTLIVWGANDQLTPPDVAEEFKAGLVNSELHFLDACGHAPMMEHPEDFNRLFLDWLGRVCPLTV